MPWMSGERSLVGPSGSAGCRTDVARTYGVSPFMSPMPTSHTEAEPGQLLHDLEQRQDEVLMQLDDLDAKLTEVLKGLGASEEPGSGSEEL